MAFNRRILVLYVLLISILTGCASILPSANEYLDWNIGDYVYHGKEYTGWTGIGGDKTTRLVYLKPGRTADNWSIKLEIVSLPIAVTFLNKKVRWNPGSILNSSSLVKCSNAENITKDEKSILYDRTNITCPDLPYKRSIGRIVMGKWYLWWISYDIKENGLTSNDRKVIIDKLSEAKIRIWKGLAEQEKKKYLGKFLGKKTINLYESGLPLQIMNLERGESKDNGKSLEATKSYGINSPINGIEEIFIHKLTKKLGSTKFKRISSKEYNEMTSGGLFVINDSDFRLETILGMTGYRVVYSAEIGFYYIADPNIFKTSRRLSVLWFSACKHVGGGIFNGIPFGEWFENDGKKLKVVIKEIQQKCGKQFADDIANYLDYFI